MNDSQKPFTDWSRLEAAQRENDAKKEKVTQVAFGALFWWTIVWLAVIWFTRASCADIGDAAERAICEGDALTRWGAVWGAGAPFAWPFGRWLGNRIYGAY